jgi:hypothetical protein
LVRWSFFMINCPKCGEVAHLRSPAFVPWQSHGYVCFGGSHGGEYSFSVPTHGHESSTNANREARQVRVDSIAYREALIDAYQLSASLDEAPRLAKSMVPWVEL